MKTLYLQCDMGAAGDMLTGALLGLLPDPEAWIRQLNGIGLDGVEYQLKTETRCGIAGSHLHVLVGEQEEEVHDHSHGRDSDHHHHHHHDHHHHHATLADVEAIVDALEVSDWVKEHVMAVYDSIAMAESKAHACHVSEVHFHEVGMLDAIADITAVCLLMEALHPDQIIASPVRIGYGSVECAHGILPVPAPATAFLLEGIPVYAGDIEGEMCTPTGAALLRHFADSFAEMPLMNIEKSSSGLGSREYPQFNAVRAFLGREEDRQDEVIELTCNLDDMSAEEIAFAMEELENAGVLDVWTVPIGMKKSRPGTLLALLVQPEQEAETVRLLFRLTSTLGIRKTVHPRYVLNRQFYTVHVGDELIQAKKAEGYGVERTKYEYEDLAAAARASGKALGEIRQEAKEKDRGF